MYIFMCMHTHENGVMCVYIFVWVCKYMHICTGVEVHQGEDGTVYSCMYMCMCVCVNVPKFVFLNYRSVPNMIFVLL